MFKNVKTIEVGRFNHRWEATSKQTGYINSLCRKVGCSLEQVIEAMFGMSCTSAFSDRAWLRLTRKEASHAIDLLRAVEQAQKAVPVVVVEDRGMAYADDEIEQERRISCDCPF